MEFSENVNNGKRHDETISKVLQTLHNHDLLTDAVRDVICMLYSCKEKRLLMNADSSYSKNTKPDISKSISFDMAMKRRTTLMKREPSSPQLYGHSI